MVNETSADLAVVRWRDLTGSLSPGTARPLVLSCSMAACVAGLVEVRDDDLQLKLRALRPLLVEELDPGHAVDRVGEAGDVRDAGPEVEHR